MNSIQTLNAAEIDEVSGGTFGLFSLGYSLFKPCLPASVQCALAPVAALDTKLFNAEMALVCAPFQLAGNLLNGAGSLLNGLASSCASAPKPTQPTCGC